MSTILQALQKSKFDQVGGPAPITAKTNSAFHWKVAVSIALSIIIVLLSTLVYLLLNPRNEDRNEGQPYLASTVELAQPEGEHNLVKVIFETKPLPILVPAPKTKKIEPKKVPIQAKEIAKIIPEINQQKEQKITLDNVPNDLRKRFEAARLLTEIEQNNNPTDVLSEVEGADDGSDIRQMSSNFQHKVPIILYDSHMYSSVVKDRWIRINSEVLKEGDFDSTGQLELLEIQPQRSIFRLDRQSFSLESLQDWKGY